MNHHPSCRPSDTVLMFVCENCGARESAEQVCDDLKRALDIARTQSFRIAQLEARLAKFEQSQEKP